LYGHLFDIYAFYDIKQTCLIRYIDDFGTKDYFFQSRDKMLTNSLGGRQEFMILFDSSYELLKYKKAKD